MDGNNEPYAEFMENMRERNFFVVSCLKDTNIDVIFFQKSFCKNFIFFGVDFFTGEK